MTKALLEDTQVSDEVLQLIKTVERLSTADQERILRIVSLLAIVPGRIQLTTKRMLRRLINGNPDAVYDCVDEIIEFLEESLLADETLLADEARAASEDAYFYLPVSHLRN